MTVRDDRGRDRGAGDALALVLLAPAAVALAMLVVFLGRQVDSRAQVQSAAESAAQAAVLQRTPAAAEHAAVEAASAVLVDADTCTAPTVSVDLSEFAPGGLVAVVVECQVSSRGIEIIDASQRTFSARAVASVDPFRTMEGAP